MMEGTCFCWFYSLLRYIRHLVVPSKDSFLHIAIGTELLIENFLKALDFVF